jgi:hypothetical protein
MSQQPQLGWERDSYLKVAPTHKQILYNPKIAERCRTLFEIFSLLELEFQRYPDDKTPLEVARIFSNNNVIH